MAYKVLSEEEQDNIIVAFYLEQERDHYCHTISLARYDAMLPDIPDGSELKEQIKELRGQTLQRIDAVERYMAAAERQLPPTQERITAAKNRLFGIE